MAFLDRFLSERLRQADPSELTRARLTVGFALFLLLYDLVFMAQALLKPTLQWHALALGIPAALAYSGLLALIHRAATIRLPALLLCSIVALAMAGFIFALRIPTAGMHAAMMLLPALSVYLLGSRRALSFTFFLILTMGIVFPLYITRADSAFTPDTHFWEMYIFASISFLGAWGLGALHNTARDQIQLSLERTLKAKRESEGKLISLFESTDDIVSSVDLQGNLITANSALNRLFASAVGRAPLPGEFLFSNQAPDQQEIWRQLLAQVATGQHLSFEEEYPFPGGRVVYENHLHPITGEEGQVVGATIFSRNVTSRKDADTRLGEMHRTLVDVSRQAGMAEIATGVLHNVGNTLNSVNIATTVLADLLRKSRVTGLAKAAQMLKEHSSDLGTFFSTDPQGQRLASYLIALSESLLEEREAMNKEVQTLSESVDHIKSIVTTQQRHARTAGAIEELHVPQLIDEALRLHAISLERLGISIVREYAEVPPILVDRHKLLQILINLLSNARHSLVDSQTQDKRLTIRVRTTEDSAQLLIEVADNGMGIAPENLSRIFSKGFTTKKTGHGFGLHISALAATEMKGRLTCASPGAGQGATFTLELPLAGEEIPP
ncbi:sensor histidine kinase [Hyalangium minutum]|uniref:histidine kinase n=1 Tax=Hyalangium minutum TaxID=394096 RepID=A0A085WCL7_9BACT|nr:ATP-binding protein [Hyalangium minutum]KFE65430.1 hypothetical protein DB31_1546 [Hyalangium minutum]